MPSITEFFAKLANAPKKDKEAVDNMIVTSSDGSEIFAGQFFEEYLEEIRGKEWAIKADRMRRSSDQVSMLLNLIKTPIVNATWNIEYDNEDIKDFVEYNLFEKLNFKQFLEEALTFFEFGHSVFEVVYAPLIKDERFPNSVVLDKLSFISPKTIEEWNLNKNGELKNIRQVVQGDLARDVKIPSRHLSVFTIQREGSNYEGRSLLRPIYGNWKRKQQLLKTQAIGIERTSMGVPIGIAKQGSNEAEKQALQKILNAFTSHQRSSVVVQHGIEIKNFSMNFDAQKVAEAIKAERLGMSQSFLAGFMDLGTNTGSGSFALSNNLMNIFLSSIQCYADKICYELNNILKVLVRVNYGPQSSYPKIKASNISDKLGKEFTEILSMLTQHGYIAPNKSINEFLRKKYNLPEEEVLVNANQEKEAENVLKKDLCGFGDNIDFAKSSNANKFIKNQRAVLVNAMITDLTKRRDTILEETRKILNSSKVKNKRKAVIEQKMLGTREYRAMILNSLVNISDIATKDVLKEVKVGNIELSIKDSDLTPDTKQRLQSEIDLIVETQESDLKKNLFFAFNNNFNNTDSTEVLIEKMKDGSDRFINGPSIATGAANFVSNAVNNARNDVYHKKEVFDEIESFTIVNPSPEAAICKELAGRTITKEQYANGDLPPFHHNCNTIVVANIKGDKNPKVSPLGLSYTGDEEQVEKIIKSKTL